MSTTKKTTATKSAEKTPVVETSAEKKPVTKKVVEKKTATPSTKTELKEGSFEGKIIGANFIASVKGTKERYSVKVTKEQSEVIKKKMELYNKRPSAAKKAEIIKMLQPVATAAKVEAEKTEAKAKGLKQQIKKETKKSKTSVSKEQKSLIQQLEEEISHDETAIPKLQAILDKYKKVEEKAPVAQITGKPTRKETYRDGRRVWIWVNKAGVEVREDGSPL